MTCQPCAAKRKFSMRKMFSQRQLFSQPYQISGTVYTRSGSTRVIEIWATKGSESTPKVRVTTRTAYGRVSFTIPVPSGGEWVLQFKSISGAYPANFTFSIDGYSRSWQPRAANSGAGGLYRFNFGELPTPEAAPEAAPKSTKPRYRVISPPNQNGTQTESIRELTAIQLESFKNRGYQVEQVDGSIPLQNPIVIGHKARAPTVPTVRRERTSVPSGMIVKPNWVPIGGRRERSHNRLVSQPVNHCWGFTRLMPNGGMAVFSGQPDHAYQGFLRQGFQLYNVQKEACSTPRLAYQSGRTAALWKKGKVVYASQSNEPTVPTPAPAPAPNNSGGGSSGGGSSGGGGNYNNGGGTTSGDIGRLIAELQGLKSQVNEINTRASQQLVDLGQSTVDRDNQIQQLDRWTQDQFSRIDQTLLALGQAQKDASEGLTAVQESILANIKQQIDGIKASVENADKGGGFLGGLGDIFGGGNLPIILIMIVVLIVMIKK